MTDPKEIKMIVFRMPENMKTEFRMALMQNRVDLQHTMESFVETFIAYVNGETYSDPIKRIIKRSQLLSKGA
jgi:hypothetical protein